MRPRSPQQDRNLRLLTAGIILVLSVIPFIGLDPYTVNYTGLFQQRPLLTWLCMGPALILQGWLFMTAAKKTPGSSSLRIPSLFLLMGVIALMIMPYRKEHDLSTNLHLVLAFAVLVLLNVLVCASLLYCINRFFHQRAQRADLCGSADRFFMHGGSLKTAS